MGRHSPFSPPCWLLGRLDSSSADELREFADRYQDQPLPVRLLVAGFLVLSRDVVHDHDVGGVQRHRSHFLSRPLGADEEAVVASLADDHPRRFDQCQLSGFAVDHAHEVELVDAHPLSDPGDQTLVTPAPPVDFPEELFPEHVALLSFLPRDDGVKVRSV